MTIDFHPGYGTILYCDFSHQTEPEIVKARPVVVLSRRNQNCQLCTVVPLSGTAPDPMRAWHHKLDRNKLPVRLRDKGDWWAKCDCITTVSFARLDRISNGRCPATGRRIYEAPKLYSEDLKGVRAAVIAHLAMTDLIPVAQ
jgi:mRNA interferase MazF